MFDPKMMETANKLVERCKAGTEAEGLDEYYADDASSYEAASMDGGPSEFHGRDAIKQKHEFWNSMFEPNDLSVEGPFFHGADKFGVVFGLDVTNRQTKERMQMREVGIYTVKDGKVVREEFYNAV